MGISYHDLDRVLNGMAFGMSDDEISEDTGVAPSKVAEVREQTVRMGHKRLSLPHPDIVFNDP